MQKPLSYRRDGQTDRRTDVISALYSREEDAIYRETLTNLMNQAKFNSK